MSLFDDTFKTIVAPTEGVFKDKGSKFIAYAYPLKTETSIKDLVAELKAQHPKARHHCWACRLTPNRSVFRVNDDGEPSGTAGRPILNILLSADVTNILVVVVRYFGGTLLGVPGLINAYKSATMAALAVAEVVELTVNDRYEIGFDYALMNDVMRLVKEEGLTVLSQHFDNVCNIQLEIRQQQVEIVLSRLRKLEGITAKFIGTA